MSGERGGQSNLKDTTSADPARSAEYAQSARARRRRKTSEVSQAIQAAIPPLMGRRTAIFATIARYGPLRVVDLEQALRVSMIREFRLETLGRAEPLGLITMWKTGRWLIIGFNPQFPLLEEMRDVLLALSRDVDFGIELTTLEHERQAPRSASRPVYQRYLFGSAVRTKAFAALEVLDGTAPSKRALAHAPPGQSLSMIRRIIGENLERGILLVKDDGSVAFDDRHSVVVPLRRLLRSYVREHPLFAAAVRERAREKYKAVAEHHEFLFCGKPSYERLLLTLASEGPMHRARALR